MKLFRSFLTISLTLASFGLTPAAFAHDDKHKHKDHDSRDSGESALRAEVRHVQGTYSHVLDEINVSGTDRHIRAEMGHINAEIDHVNQELAYRDVDSRHIREELSHIHDELHHIDEQLHQKRDDRHRGGFTIQVR